MVADATNKLMAGISGIALSQGTRHHDTRTTVNDNQTLLARANTKSNDALLFLNQRLGARHIPW